jgi:hypothetical protein
VTLTLVKKVFWKKGTYEKKNRKARLESIAGTMYGFQLGPFGLKGFAWRILSLRVREASKLPHCMPTRVKK